MGNGDLTPEQLDGMEVRRHRAAQTASADRLRAVVQAEAYSVIHRGTLASFDVSQLADDIAERVASQIGPIGLSAEERAIVEQLRENQVKTKAAIGHLDEGVRQSCDATIALLDRLLDAQTSDSELDDVRRSAIAALRSGTTLAEVAASLVDADDGSRAELDKSPLADDP